MPGLRVVVLTILVMAMTVPYSAAQIFSNDDTLSVVGISGYPGDTVVVSFDLLNNFYAAGFQIRVTYNPIAFAPVSVALTSRDSFFDLFGSDFTQPGVVSYFATSWDPRQNSIAPGSGSIIDLTLAIRITAVPDSYLIKFENADSLMYQNALSTIGGDSLIIPIFEERYVVVNPGENVGDESIVPGNFSLNQNYPNPFNSSTVLSFSLDSPQNVELSIFNILGENVITLYSGAAEAGQTAIVWNGANGGGEIQASGIYLYRLKIAGGETVFNKMTLMK